jgi:hypothetical protein
MKKPLEDMASGYSYSGFAISRLWRSIIMDIPAPQLPPQLAKECGLLTIR